MSVNKASHRAWGRSFCRILVPLCVIAGIHLSFNANYLSVVAPILENNNQPSSSSSPNSTMVNLLRSCAPREGIIIVNTLGRLANNIFQLAFAKRLAHQLCWDDNILYRPVWQGEYPNNPRSAYCFPNAGLAINHRRFPSTISEKLQAQLGWNASIWRKFAPGDAELQSEYLSLTEGLVEKGLAISIENRPSHVQFWTGRGVNKLLESVRDEDVSFSMVSLSAFFIHSDWMKGWEDMIRHWFSLDPSCCFDQPPEDAVVIHARQFAEDEIKRNNLKSIGPDAYRQILQQYDLLHRPLWIVCEKSIVESAHIQTLARISTKPAKIVTGRDQYDALCILTRAKTLLLSYSSTFSQIAAVLAGPSATVHYPMMSKKRPKDTISVPGWKYHLISENSTILQFDVPQNYINFGKNV